ncbi:MAG: hypothetical protein E7150_09340 [Bacillus sp. (in: Bacteria)]|nr:hypothetical protein [Bacillus sp. (in: firmicutes)]
MHKPALEIDVDSCGRIGIGETPQCMSTARGGSPAIAESEVYFRSAIFGFSFVNILLARPL